jgi:hypothetical protein
MRRQSISPFAPFHAIKKKLLPISVHDFLFQRHGIPEIAACRSLKSGSHAESARFLPVTGNNVIRIGHSHATSRAGVNPRALDGDNTEYSVQT